MKYFFESAFKGYLELVKLFVENGFEIDSIDIDGETPLFKAVKGQSIGVCKYLYINGAKINVQNIYGEDIMSKIFASENPLIKDYFSVQINSFRSEQTTYIIDSESSSVKTSCYTKV